MNHKNKVMSSLEYKYHICPPCRVGKKWPHTFGFESVLFLCTVVESKIFHCKVENLLKPKKFWLLPRRSEAPGAPVSQFLRFLNFQLCIEICLFIVLEGYI